MLQDDSVDRLAYEVTPYRALSFPFRYRSPLLPLRIAETHRIERVTF